MKLTDLRVRNLTIPTPAEKITKTITYANGVPQRVDLSDGSYKILTWVSGKLVQSDLHVNGVVTTTTYQYDANGMLASTQ